MNQPSRTSTANQSPTRAHRRPGVIEYSQLLLTVLGIFMGVAYIGRALLAA